MGIEFILCCRLPPAHGDIRCTPRSDVPHVRNPELIRLK